MTGKLPEFLASAVSRAPFDETNKVANIP